MSKVSAKNTFSEVVVNLMEEKPLSDIRVSEIVTQSHLTRQCFYAHFQDKFDLVNQVFHANTVRSFVTLSSSHNKINDTILLGLKMMSEKPSFYLNAFQYKGQNSLFSFVEQETYDIHSHIVHPKNMMLMPEQETLYCLHFYSCSVASTISDWALSGMKESPKDVSDLIVDCIPSGLKRFYKSNVQNFFI